MINLKSIFLCLTWMLLSSPVFADDLTFVGTTKQTVTTTQSNTMQYHQAEAQPHTTTITLPEYQLSEAAQHQVHQHATDVLQQRHTSNLTRTPKLPKKKQLGMGNVPVLNQGGHGTCATFAVTAAADAIMNQGDRISQLCLLQLGNYLETQGRGRSGWDGLSIYAALDRLTKYGFISSSNQKKYGCGGIKNYPYYNIDRPYSSLTDEAYAERRVASSEKRFIWKTVFSTLARPSTNRVHAIKAALDEGHRVIISTLVPCTYLGNVGAMAWHHYLNDTWVLNETIADHIKDQTYFASHAIVITGYDDDAVAMDLSGHRHHGLFTLRNSWGRWVGDWGDFYMSYEYADVLAHRGELLLERSMKP